MTQRNARLVALLLAALLPIVGISSAMVFYVAVQERERLVSDVSAKARAAVDQLDSLMSGDINVLRALATSEHLDQDKFPLFREQARRIQEAQGHWHTVILAATDGRNILNLRRAPTDPLLPIVDSDSFEQVLWTKGPVIGGISLPGTVSQFRLVPLRVPVMRDGELRYVLTAVVYPDSIAELIRKVTPADWLGVVIDQSGRVVASTNKDPEYVGALAPEKVRQAIGSGEKSGILKARALSGEDMTAAYRMSPLSGWSVHFAVQNHALELALFSRPVLLALAGAILSVTLAAALLWLVHRDLTLQRTNEAALRQAQKMEAVGQLTGGLAHDFNNILTVITMNCEILSDLLTDQPEKKTFADMLLQAAHRGADLIQRLLSFSRHQVLMISELDVNGLVAGVSELLRRTLGASIQVQLKLADDLWPAVSDATQLETAVMNLAINARDAMPKGGILTIETRNVQLNGSYAKANPGARPGDYVMVAVSDTGTGMSKEVVNRAFEPFYSTKEVGKGTGLGLSMVYGFAKQSAGHVDIDSKLGHGTAVRVYLPRAFEKTLSRD